VRADDGEGNVDDGRRKAANHRHGDSPSSSGGPARRAQSVAACSLWKNRANGTDRRTVTLTSLLISGQFSHHCGTCTNSGAPCTFVAGRD